MCNPKPNIRSEAGLSSRFIYETANVDLRTRLKYHERSR